MYGGKSDNHPPSGEVLFTLGSFPITAGALQWGLIKTTTLLGLIYLSQFAIHPGLQLPGVLGGIIGKTFFYFERIQEEYRHKPLYRRNQKATEKVKGEKRHGIRHISRYFKYDKLIQRLDEVLLLAFSDSEKSKDQQSGPSLKNKPIHGQSRFFLPTLYGLVILNWLAFISILLK
jgi:hypothetical protein